MPVLGTWQLESLLNEKATGKKMARRPRRETTLVESPLRQIEDAGGNTLKDNNIYDGENIIQIQ